MSDDVISGYAVKYNDQTVIGSYFREQIAPGAFDRSLRENPDVLCLLAHDLGRVLGRTTAGTLRLRSDRIGLFFTVTPDPKTPSGQEALGTVGRQDVKGMSFGFMVRGEEWTDGGDKLPLRTITDADLAEVSVVAMPAYETTSAAIRDREAAHAVANKDRRERNFLSGYRRRAEAAMRTRGISF